MRRSSFFVSATLWRAATSMPPFTTHCGWPRISESARTTGELSCKVACKIVIRPFQPAQMARLRQRCMGITEHGLHAVFVLGIYLVQQRLERVHMLRPVRIADEFRREPTSEHDMHLADTARRQQQIPKIAGRQGD